MMFTIERYHDICAGHRVYGHESKCAHLHGHNYRVTFVCTQAQYARTVNASKGLDTVGRVIDFSEVKERLCEWLERMWDHKMLLWQNDPLALDLLPLDPEGVIPVPFNPTAENMAEHLVETVGPIQLAGTGIVLVSVRIEETRKCVATYTRTDL